MLLVVLQYYYLVILNYQNIDIVDSKYMYIYRRTATQLQPYCCTVIWIHINYSSKANDYNDLY